jgi:hypothetical protein
MLRAVGGLEPERVIGVAAEDEDENEGEIEEVTVDVLQDERQETLAEIAAAGLAHGAIHRVHPERLIISAAIVVTGETEAGRDPHDQKRRRERKIGRPPVRHRAEPAGMNRTAENRRRIKGREIIRAATAEPVGALAHVGSLQRGPSRINDESGEA